MPDAETAIGLKPKLPDAKPATVGPEHRVLIAQDVTGDRDPNDPNPAPQWQPVTLSAANYREVLKTLKPRFIGAVPDPLSADPEAVIAIDVILDAPTPEWPALLADRVPPLKARRDKIAKLERLAAVLLQRQAIDADLAAVYRELFPVR
ncbi:MAG TPA: hypothetical protein VKE74_30850 [Gemmataceae bacterium]|nr:hypothetical protein [Gemmataceae bacterium]